MSYRNTWYQWIGQFLLEIGHQQRNVPIFLQYVVEFIKRLCCMPPTTCTELSNIQSSIWSILSIITACKLNQIKLISYLNRSVAIYLFNAMSNITRPDDSSLNYSHWLKKIRCDCVGMLSSFPQSQCHELYYSGKMTHV